MERRPLTLSDNQYEYIKDIWRHDLSRWYRSELEQRQAGTPNSRAGGPRQAIRGTGSETSTALIRRQRSDTYALPQGQQNVPIDQQFSKELEIMAGVLAYFEISVIRIIDHVAMAIREKLVERISAEIDNNIAAKLGLEGEDGEGFALRWGFDSEETLEHRRELYEIRNKLSVVMKELRSLSNGGA